MSTNNGKVVQGLPPIMGTWIWEYQQGHGYTGRHAYSESNPELSLPVRQIYEIRRNPANYKTIIERALIRRDVLVKIVDDYDFQHRQWRGASFQFSTGALRFIENLSPTTKIFVTVYGIPTERYFSQGVDMGLLSDEPVTRTVSGYRTASYYNNTARFYQEVTLPAYANFSPIYYFTVHYQI